MSKRHTSYSPASRSILGKSVPEVLDNAKFYRPGHYLRQRTQFSPIWTDLGE